MPFLVSRLAVTTLLVTLAPGLAATGNAIGTFLTEDGRARVRTEHCGPDNTELCGYIVWLDKPADDKGHPQLDKDNPDPHKRARPLLGHQFIMGLKLTEDGRYAGKIYNGDNGKFYDVTIWSDEPQVLIVRGCMLAVLCKSQTWTRVTDVVPGQLAGPTNGPGGPRSDPEWAPKHAK